MYAMVQMNGICQKIETRHLVNKHGGFAVQGIPCILINVILCFAPKDSCTIKQNMDKGIAVGKINPTRD